MLPSFISVWLLARVTNNAAFTITPPVLWLILGIIFGSIELFVPKSFPKKYKFVSLMMGGSALITAFILWRGASLYNFDWQLVMYEDFDWQIWYWMGMSITGLIWIRPIFIPRKRVTIPDATEAKTVTDILPGQTGKVVYEGCLWQACCVDNQTSIASARKVYVLRREGNTLIVAPEHLFHS